MCLLEQYGSLTTQLFLGIDSVGRLSPDLMVIKDNNQQTGFIGSLPIHESLCICYWSKELLVIVIASFSFNVCQLCKLPPNDSKLQLLATMFGLLINVNGKWQLLPTLYSALYLAGTVHSTQVAICAHHLAKHCKCFSHWASHSSGILREVLYQAHFWSIFPSPRWVMFGLLFN